MPNQFGNEDDNAQDDAASDELSAMINMIDYLLPQCKGLSPVTTVLLALARRELVTVHQSNQEVIRNIAARA
jgi:hypothetical protein